MTDKIEKNDVLHVADLAKLSLTGQDVDRFTEQLQSILELVDTLNQVDTSDVVPTYSAASAVNVFREDTPVDYQQNQALLNNAPAVKDDMIQVPSILEGEDDGN
jgi:aspartyl-tRNA(Asn)/glutamyl-tRNA(Gln) amidotransferase subunit C